MPLLILRTTDPCSLLNSWHCPSMPLPYLSQFYEDPSSSMKNDSFPTSSLISETIQSLQNALIISQILSGLSLPMVYSAIPIEYMFPIMAIFDSVFRNTCMTIPLQVISVRPRHFIQSRCNMPGLVSQSTSKTTANRAPLVPVQNPCATNHMDFSQLLVPKKPWNLISLDFIEKLPLSSSGYTAILVIVD